MFVSEVMLYRLHPGLMQSTVLTQGLGNENFLEYVELELQPSHLGFQFSFSLCLKVHWGLCCIVEVLMS